MKTFCFFLGTLFVTLLAPVFAWGASNTFTITQQIGTDTNPPTTPTLVSVTPIAPTQIDVTWSAATDDVMVAGYRLFRDSVQIATTTLLTFSDVGLTASTTYTYTVDAFDTFGNISSTSNSLATTTPPTPPVATSTPTSTPSGGSSGTKTAPTLETLTITTKQTEALFTWVTSGPTQYSLVWGRTPSYELGSVSGVAFTRNHATTISGLEPGTTYYYELRGTNVRGITEIISQAAFTTLPGALSQTVPNVRGFRADVEADDVRLHWDNAFSNPNYYVRIVRSHLFYPENIQDGAVVYEGKGQTFLDENALRNRSPQYYTIFVLDGTGAFSSGAVARAALTTQPVGTSSISTTPIGIIPEDIGDDTILRATDISIIQNAVTQVFDTELSLDANASYIVSVPYSAVAKNLKSIIVSVQNPSNQKELSSYLLKLNQSGDAYTAAIAGPAVVGTAGIMIEVFDYEAQTVRRISTVISFTSRAAEVPFFPDRLLGYLFIVLPIFIIVTVIFWFILLFRRRRRKETS